MSKIFEDNSLTIGHTPLVRLNRIGNGTALIPSCMSLFPFCI